MGSDPCPVEDYVKGTVVAVDDIGTVHCEFDNDRSPGLIPDENSFHRLTAEELTQEQDSSIEEEDGPVMGGM